MELMIAVVIYVAGIIVMTPVLIMSVLSHDHPRWVSIGMGFVMACIWPWFAFLMMIGYPMFDDQYLKERRKRKRKDKK